MPNDNRLPVALSPEQKELIARAAQARGMRLATYIRQAALKAAHEDLAEEKAT